MMTVHSNVTVIHDNKYESLRASGTLNPRPEQVVDVLFRGHGFFDPRDLVQVKIEMLHRVTVAGMPVIKAAADFGYSRVAFYQLQARYDALGITGLLPQRRGPKPHDSRPQKQRSQWVDYTQKSCNSVMKGYETMR